MESRNSVEVVNTEEAVLKFKLWDRDGATVAVSATVYDRAAGSAATVLLTPREIRFLLEWLNALGPYPDAT